MSGKKIEQAKEALKFVLNNLREGDMFNIVAYDSAVESFRPELQKFDDETRKAALGFVEGLYAGGSTNIDGALTTALEQLKDTQPAELRDLPDRRPADGRRDERSARSSPTPSSTTRCGRGSSASASATTSTAGCSTGWRATNFGQSEYVRPERGHRSPRQPRSTTASARR